MTNRTFALAVLSLCGLFFAGVAVLTGVMPTQPKAGSPLCQTWEHALAHQEQAMVQCFSNPKCYLSAPDFALHDTIAEQTAKVCPAQTPEGVIVIPQQSEPSPQSSPRPSGPLKHDGFTAEQQR